MEKVLVLGAGMVGRAMAIDLCTSYEVTAADINGPVLQHLAKEHPVKTVKADLSKADVIAQLVPEYDLVVGAVPGHMGYSMLKTVIECGKNIVDISFFPEDPFDLDELARQKNVTAVVDCGVAPGMSNLLLGYHAAHMQISDFTCLVGGLPRRRTWPFEYKAPFSPIDVIEEYLRPARLVENGVIVTRPALSEPELVDLEPVGTLEAFNTDGLRSLLRTMNIKNMKEKTMRYPGHIEIMRIFRETGFFSSEPVLINGAMVTPLDVTAKLLLPKWHLKEEEEEFTIMRITISGLENGRPRTIAYSLFDTYHAATRISSMARTTGYTATAAVHLLLDGDFTRRGICPPEYIGAEPCCTEKMLAYLKAREIHYLKTTD